MVMSEADICLEYNQAKTPSLQVEILADMNLCSKEDIMGVLIRNGTDMSKAVNHRSRRNSATLSQVMMAELEAADAAVRAAVKRYEQMLKSIEKTGGKDMSIKYVCDRCGKTIEKKDCFEVRVENKCVAMSIAPEDWKKKDLCQDCAERIVRMAFAKTATINQNFKDAVNEMAEPLVSGWELATQLLQRQRTAESKPVKTNFDRLGEMPLDELAERLAHGKCGFCEYCDTACGDGPCSEGISEWLNEEVSE